MISSIQIHLSTTIMRNVDILYFIYIYCYSTDSTLNFIVIININLNK